MLSLRTIAFALATGLVAAQVQYHIDPESIDISTREYWCDNELATCPSICEQFEPGTTDVNTCEPETLDFRCICGNGLAPNMTEYTVTLPFHICQEWGNQCVTACGRNNACASACREDHPCGARDPSRPNATTTSGAPTSTSTGPSLATNGNFDNAGGDDNDDRDSAATVAVGRTYGLAIVLGTLFAGFAML
ncbi:hypothetical protein B0I35DRAFT_274637 [Stachybotrys elegans]|uniref:DUF7707 domain-containing protein n=1 Tax=Stachybotrys elegans TaxID=80388 RepID=A0A8K0WPN9_9HYPO|nr:hypothetical protein B0I35DRAFT_274637 [Stachybotrys elegans]